VKDEELLQAQRDLVDQLCVFHYESQIKRFRGEKQLAADEVKQLQSLYSKYEDWEETSARREERQRRERDLGGLSRDDFLSLIERKIIATHAEDARLDQAIAKMEAEELNRTGYPGSMWEPAWTEPEEEEREEAAELAVQEEIDTTTDWTTELAEAMDTTGEATYQNT
jgi:hypothetical protein